MGVSQWPKVALKGTSQVIPRVCPNCLHEADVSLRYCYIRPWDVFRPTRYFQSFRYCGTCAPAAEADLKHHRRTDWLRRVPGLMVVLFAAVLSTLLIVDAVLPGSHDPKERSPVAAVAFAGSVAAAVLLAWLCVRWSGKSALRRCPRQPGQAVWGVAAYYTGSPILDLLGNSKVYRAARPEWLAALVRANRDQVDDATYRLIAGEERPPRDTRRPFAA